jgi:hypothetical protein
MPRIDQGYNAPAKRAPRTRTRHVGNADTGDPARSRPAPARAPTFTRPPLERSFSQQQAQARQRVNEAYARLPKAPIAAPPIIRNPTPVQVRAAHDQIVHSIRVAVGTSGSQAEVNARRDELLHEIRTQPRYAPERRSITHWVNEANKISRPQTTPLKAGPPDKKFGVGFATINLTAAQHAAAAVGARVAPSLQGNTPEDMWVKHSLSDIAHLPLMGPQASYEILAASFEAAKGDTHRAKALASGFMHGVYGSVIRGDWKGLEDYVREHPVYAALEIRGGKGVVGRGLGAAMRSGALGDAARVAASTKRPDLQLAGGTGSRVADRRHYSPDVLTKAAQVAGDKLRGGKPVLGDHRLRRRADMESDMAASTSRTVRADEGRSANRAKPKGPLADVVGLVTQGVVRAGHVEADLRKELQRLDDRHATGEFSTGAQRRQNRATADAIRKVLDTPAAMARISELVASGRANVRRINELEGQVKALGAGTPERMERAALFPAAQAHLGARHAGMTRQQGRQVVAKARTELERARGARDHTLERLKGEGVKKPTAHPDYVKAARRVARAKQGLASARSLRRSGAVMLRDHANDPLPNAAIRAVVGEDVAFLPHHTRNRGARAYYQTQFAGRKNLDTSEKRTGAAFEKGAVDVSYDAVKEHRIRLRGVVNRIAEHDRIVHSVAITAPKTKKNPQGLMTWDQAEKIASNAKDRGGKLVPYRAVPGSYDKARIARISGMQNAPEAPDLARMIGQEFEHRLKEPPPGDRSARNVVLIPEQIANQLKEQQAVSSSAGRVGNVAADVFRRTVLPFSTKWIAGNDVEGALRLAAVGAGPNAVRIGRGVMRELEKMDHEQALRVKSALVGGLMFGNKGLTVRRFAEHFEGTAFEKPAKALGVAGHAPVIHQLGQLIKEYTDGVFALNRAFESTAQYAALGKWAKREMQELTGSWAKATRAQEKALQDVARGMFDTKNIHDAARYIDETLGQYSRFSPPMRRFIQSAAPFLPWYVNAARWVFWTLPAKHPIKSGIAALVAQNLQADFDASHQGLPPGDLRGDIVTGSGTVLPYGHYTPFGAFGKVLGGGNEQLTALVDPLFPQFKSAGLAAFGLNFSGHPAKVDPKDRGDRGEVTGAVRISMAINALLEAFVPVLGIARRVREGGSTPWDNSTLASPKTKPGTRVKGGAANRILNPARSSPIRGDRATSSTTTMPAAAPEPTSVEDDLLNNLDQSLGAAQDQQAVEDELLNNLYGGG